MKASKARTDGEGEEEPGRDPCPSTAFLPADFVPFGSLGRLLMKKKQAKTNVSINNWNNEAEHKLTWQLKVAEYYWTV